jgi:hypothetical protein
LGLRFSLYTWMLHIYSMWIVKTKQIDVHRHTQREILESTTFSYELCFWVPVAFLKDLDVY